MGGRGVGGAQEGRRRGRGGGEKGSRRVVERGVGMVVSRQCQLRGLRRLMSIVSIVTAF